MTRLVGREEVAPVTLAKSMWGVHHNEKKTTAPGLPPPRDDSAKQKGQIFSLFTTPCLLMLIISSI